MAAWHSENTDALCQALLSLKTREDCYAFLDDVCTIKEIQDMASRFTVARMLSCGKSYTEIIRQTGASTATISRVNKCLEYGAGGYRAVIEKMKGQNEYDG